ncbi:MAG: DUF2846 domain-containing protein [Gammaproteobacteria bacterium]|nr:DUF2846 domain-containing protein [Gammaproteobacteria bacterium]MDH5727518.1 DUF2846 domain-containing protein [Gammaproteobacteria bacterium]
MNKTVLSLLLIIVALGLSACTTSLLVTENPQLEKNRSAPHAIVYFIRPMPIRSRGVADNDLKVELNEKPLLTLTRGEYAMARIKPQPTDVVLRNMTFITTKPMPVEVWRARRFSFEAGKTYFIKADFKQEEFRGIYFVPELIDEVEAKSLAKKMRAAGQLAKAHPITQPDPMFTQEYDLDPSVLD